LLLTVGIGAGTYVMYLKSATPGGAASPMQAISTTTVKMQLLNIAQSEKTYYVQNSSYATIEQLSSSGWLTLKDPDPTGYHYSVAVTTAPDGFTVTAQHDESKGGLPNDYPTMTIDETMKVQGGN
jgi:hypothetical protein